VEKAKEVRRFRDTSTDGGTTPKACECPDKVHGDEPCDCDADLCDCEQAQIFTETLLNGDVITVENRTKKDVSAYLTSIFVSFEEQAPYMIIEMNILKNRGGFVLIIENGASHSYANDVRVIDGRTSARVPQGNTGVPGTDFAPERIRSPRARS
jgi:hypothetical protein